MGYFYYFSPAPPLGMANQFTKQAIREWLGHAYKIRSEFPDEYRPAMIELAERLVEDLHLSELGTEDYATFDELIHTIIAHATFDELIRTITASDGVSAEATADETAILSYRTYRQKFEKIGSSLTPALRQILHWPLIGRPIWRDAERFPYITEANYYNVSYWTAEEVAQVWREWPFDAETTRTISALHEALATAQTQGVGLTMLST